jgi:hypothetical protein
LRFLELSFKHSHRLLEESWQFFCRKGKERNQHKGPKDGKRHKRHGAMEDQKKVEGDVEMVSQPEKIVVLLAEFLEDGSGDNGQENEPEKPASRSRNCEEEE